MPNSIWGEASVAELERAGVLLVQDGNHGAYRPRPHEIVKHGIPHIRAADIEADGRIDFAGAQQLADSAWQRIRKGRGLGGDTLLTHKGTVGRVAAAPVSAGPFLCSPQTTLWRSLDETRLDQGYITAFLRSGPLQEQLRRVMHESDMAPYVSLTSQRGLSVSVPPVADQRAIASVLRALDDKIESNLRLAKHLVKVIDLAYGRASHRAVPATLDSLGAVAGGGTPKSSELGFWLPGEVPWITPKDMTALAGTPVVWRGERDISAEGLRSSSARLLPAGAVLFTSRATLGLIAVAQQPLATNQGFISIVPAEGLSSVFVYSTLKAQSAAIREQANGSTFLEVNKTNFKAVPCSMPTGDILAGFDAIAVPALAGVASSVSEVRTLTAIRDALLPKLVSGQIRVPLSDDPEEGIGAAVEALDAAPA